MDRRIVINRKRYEEDKHLFALVAGFLACGWQLVLVEGGRP